MTSVSNALAGATGAFVWAWLPGHVDPVVVGRVEITGSTHAGPDLSFTYGARYRQRSDAMSLFSPELPLRPGTFDPLLPEDPLREPGLLASTLRDAAPDAWGRRVINLQLAATPDVDLSELTYLLASSSDRIGALDFQASAEVYVPRGGAATLEQLMTAAERTEAGEPIPPDLAAAAGHGTSIGGARPKATLQDGARHLIAKFSSSTDDRPVVKIEALGMLLAPMVGIDAAAVEVVHASGKDVLLVERFDRTADGGRRMLVSGLTVLGLAEASSRYGTYPMLADAAVALFGDARLTLNEMYRRLVFNVVIGNNDDHLRNVAAFWDGAVLSLTPAYDLTPQVRNTNVSYQALAITPDGGRASQLRVVRAAASVFRMSSADADAVIDEIVTGVGQGFDEAADRAQMTKAERDLVRGREILNPYIHYEYA